MGEYKPEREGWVTIFQTSTDYEADMVRDRLDSAGIPAAVFTQRDHALNLNVGKLALVFVMVPEEHRADAEALLAELPLTDAELNSAAEASTEQSGEDDSGKEQLLDSGIERLRFDSPEEPPDEDLT
ncbi:MAG TPA: DUF2007 domain-containing protein [Rhodothermales bacterium]|nr:DUF2007 domain-containing protein [Rhodothermales bacterium]